MKKNVVSALARTSRLSLLLALLIFTASTAFAAKLATVDIPVQADLYAVAPVPLSPTQCAQCHTGVFGSLKDAGGKHRFDCQQCHTYNPKKANYDEVMPKCASCHTDVHGPANKDCSTCHTNPHTPRKVAMSPRLAGTCATCHTGPKAELTQFPSKHTQVACDRCHTSHGFKPSCFKCHTPHFKDQLADSCTKCHSVHKPKQVTYAAGDWTATCASCHDVHNKDNVDTAFLYEKQAGSQFCLMCHDK